MGITDIAKELSYLLELTVRNDYGEGRQIVRAVLGTIAKALERGEVVKIAGFGKFEVKSFKPKKKNNLIVAREGSTIYLSPEPVECPARKKVVFTPSSHLLATITPPEAIRNRFIKRSYEAIQRDMKRNPDVRN